jgi:hypothetical protein
MENNDTIKE